MNLLSELLSQSPQPAPTKKQRRGIEIKSEREIAIMREAAQIIATVLKEISEQVKPGMTTGEVTAHRNFVAVLRTEPKLESAKIQAG